MGPVNTLLWGCESWEITADIRRKLETFYHSSIRRILFIGWEQMKEQRIANEMARRQFWNIPPLRALINRRIWQFFRKMHCSYDNNNFPKKF
jgi:hypothetical protein